MAESFERGDKSLLAAIPKLSSISKFSTWRIAFENYALATGCAGILDGTITEPGLIDIAPILAAGQPVVPATAVAPGAMAGISEQAQDAGAAVQGTAGQAGADYEVLVRNYQGALAEQQRRTLRAGAVPPAVFAEGVSRKEWEHWARKEGHMQGALRGTVSSGVLVDIKDLRSARAMWEFVHIIHPIDTAENRAAVRRDLSTITLTDTSPRGMEVHLERFNSIILRSHEAGSPIGPAERAQLFVDTLPHQLQSLRTIWGLTSPSLDKFTVWPALLKLYNEEIDRRRRARVLDRTYHAFGDESLGEWRESSRFIKEEEAKDGHQGPLPGPGEEARKGVDADDHRGSDDEDHDGCHDGEGEVKRETRTCYNCGVRGHLERDCRSPPGDYRKGHTDARNDYRDEANFVVGHQAMVVTKAIPKTKMANRRACRDEAGGDHSFSQSQ